MKTKTEMIQLPIDLTRLDDAQLKELQRAVVAESSRRFGPSKPHGELTRLPHWRTTRMTDKMKRAAVIAAAGKFTILLAGPSKSHKFLLREMCQELGLPEECIFTRELCDCGYRATPLASCRCSIAAATAVWDGLPDTHMFVITECVPQSAPYSDEHDYLQEIRQASGYSTRQLDDLSVKLMNGLLMHIQNDAKTQERLSDIARVIANLARSEKIQADHLCEAAQYLKPTFYFH